MAREAIGRTRERRLGGPLASLVLCAITVLSSAARTPESRERSEMDLDPRAARSRFDVPVALRGATARVAADTARLGGLGPDGLAIPGGVWDFEDGTLQGWGARDLTDRAQVDPPGDPAIGGPGASYFRHITAGDFSGSPIVPLISGTGSLWVGANEEEAASGCWPGGMGYDNHWLMRARKAFAYGGSGTVTMTFDYFFDSETQFDFTYVYTEVDGVRSSPLNTSMHSTPEGWGYSGSVDEGTAPFSPDAPATDTIVVDTVDLPGGTGASFEIVFEFDSDPLFSDGVDSFSSFLNSRYGPFGLDDFVIDGVALSDTDDFEVDAEGWSFERRDPIGAFQQVVALSLLDPIEDTCACPITGDPDDDYVMVASDWDLSHGPHHHPRRQRVFLFSNPAYVGPGSGLEGHRTRLVEWDVWEDLHPWAGVGYRIAMDYYPWTCPETALVRWTLVPAGDGGFVFTGLGGARCVSHVVDNSEWIPDDVDSLRIAFELISDCDDFAGECWGADSTDQSPYWDNLNLTLVEGPLDAPPLSLDLLYQDAFPSLNSLQPSATADVHSFLDTNRQDGDPTNARLGDSATVISSVRAAVFLNFRVTPGPALTDGALDAILVANGGVPDGPGDAIDDGGFLEVRMCELPGPDHGAFATYLHDGSPYDGSQPKILPDGVLTPGTTVEYFFSARDAIAPVDTRVEPDTTAGDDDPATFFFLELDVLPGLRDVGAPGDPVIVYASVLYVDAFNAGAQEIIETEGLRPRLGTGVGSDGVVFDRWDRYDYLGAGSNVPAPMAREPAGDNGMTTFQSLAYRTILYNTGSLAQEGLRDGDADLLIDWLTLTRPGDNGFTRGLWLSGDGIASILDRAGRPSSNALLSSYAGASVTGRPYRDVASPDDPSFCARLDADPASTVSAPGSYASVRGSGCPGLLDFSVLGAVGPGAGDLVYVDQDAGGSETPFASVTSDVEPYRVVLDGFSVHALRYSPSGWTGDGDARDAPGDGTPCADHAVLARLSDVFDFLEVPPDPLIEPWEPIATPPAGAAPGRTRLYAASPNPFNPNTTIRYDVGAPTNVRLDVLDVGGRRVRTLVDENRGAGPHVHRWDGADDGGRPVAPGMYWAWLRTGRGYEHATKLVLLK